MFQADTRCTFQQGTAFPRLTLADSRCRLGTVLGRPSSCRSTCPPGSCLRSSAPPGVSPRSYCRTTWRSTGLGSRNRRCQRRSGRCRLLAD
eukprot:scaffold3386_cov59-Phaeocystis_antarctica.AAC.7